MSAEFWERKVGRKYRQLRDNVGVIFHPITWWLHPKIEIGIADARRPKSVTGRDLIVSKYRRGNLRKRAAKRMAS